MSTDLKKVENQEIEQTSQRPTVVPLVDIYENNDEVLVLADMPGVDKNGVTLDFENKTLTILGTASLPELDGNALFREFDVVDYRRAFELAPGIDAEGISAELSGGTLTIHLPKSAALKPRKIPISVG